MKKISSKNAYIVRRAAFDFGSGSIKMQIADVNIDKQIITESYLSDFGAVRFNDDLEETGACEFSEKLFKRTMEVIHVFKQIAKKYEVKEFAGFATEAFRKAHNSEALFQMIYKNYGIPIIIVSQDVEAQLGFQTTMMSAMEINKDLVVWDIGAGSMQLVTNIKNAFSVIKTSVARTTTGKELAIAQGKDFSVKSSPHPLSAKEAQQAISMIKQQLPDISSDWQQWLQKSIILGIGGQPRSLFFHQKYYSIDQLRAYLAERFDKTDNELSSDDKSEESIQTQLSILAQATMEKYGISTVKCIETKAGNTSAFLINPAYWYNFEEKTLSR